MDKKGRLIVRNINYDLREKHMKLLFGSKGELVDVKVPLKQENDLNKGFAFVEFKTRDEARAALESLNGTKYKGRTLAIDFAVSKKIYTEKVSKMSEEVATRQAKKEKNAKDNLKGGSKEVASDDEDMEDAEEATPAPTPAPVKEEKKVEETPKDKKKK